MLSIKGPGTSRWMGLLLVGTLSCAPSNDVPAGAPQLTGFDVVDPMGQPVSLDADAGPVMVPPLAHFVASFDRLLDPSTLEVVTDAGVSGKSDVASIMAMGNPMAAVTYTPNGSAKYHLLFAPGPTLTIAANPTLPSGSMITVKLDRAKIRAKDQKTTAALGMGAKDTLTFQTMPFAAEIQLPAVETPDGGMAAPPTVAADFAVPVVFNNLPEETIKTKVKVSGKGADGAALMLDAQVKADEANPTALQVAPGDKGWPAGATITITVEDAADALGMKLGAPATATFVVKS